MQPHLLLTSICRFWDYHSGNRFQDEQTIVQPGSLESEAGINCMSFDVSGSRLITGEVDKTIKCAHLPLALLPATLMLCESWFLLKLPSTEPANKDHTSKTAR